MTFVERMGISRILSARGHRCARNCSWWCSHSGFDETDLWYCRLTVGKTTKIKFSLQSSSYYCTKEDFLYECSKVHGEDEVLAVLLSMEAA